MFCYSSSRKLYQMQLVKSGTASCFWRFIKQFTRVKSEKSWPKNSVCVWVCVSLCVCVSVCVHVCAQSCQTLWFLWICNPQDTWNFPSKTTAMDCHSLFQGIFLTQELNSSLLHLLHWQAGSLPLCHLGSLTLVLLFIDTLRLQMP